MEQMLLKVMRWKLCEFNVEISDEKRDGDGNREGQEGGGSDLSSSYSRESNILLILAVLAADMCVQACADVLASSTTWSYSSQWRFNVGPLSRMLQCEVMKNCRVESNVH